MCNFTLLFEAEFQIDGRFKIELKSNLPERFLPLATLASALRWDQP